MTLRLDRRIIPEENGAKVENALVALITRAGARENIQVECRRILLADPLKPVKGVARLVKPFQRHAHDVLGVSVEAMGVPLYTDARHYAARGIPTVLYGAGPRLIEEANAHAADEHVQLSDLRAAIAIVAAALRDLLKSQKPTAVPKRS